MIIFLHGFQVVVVLDNYAVVFVVAVVVIFVVVVDVVVVVSMFFLKYIVINSNYERSLIEIVVTVLNLQRFCFVNLADARGGFSTFPTKESATL